ncbi:hypothetical protein J3458_002683 [Metarhizium acridum]|uniref:uncharacterized protein n=1 Tax=Metarhizium acridum TaxID=92637 RepID=UPI001C6AEB1D|nr:hypothetical protein J3458_002683 [Metarhizium acridum]
MNSTKDLCEIPAGKPPGGKYNFIDPPSLGPTVIAVGTTLLAISTAFTVGRLFINRSKLHSADYITFVACLVNIAYTGVIIAQHNSFHHAWDVPVCFYTGQFLQLPFIQTVLFSPVFFFSKAAIFLLYRQLFATGRRLKIAINLGLAATFLVYLSNIPLAAVYAAPDPGKPWSSLLVKLQTKGQKFSLAGAVQSAVGTAIDLYIFFLPMPILLGLHLPLKRRLQLVCVFSIALLGVAASVVSLYVKTQLLSSDDLSWLGPQASLCSLIETDVAIIVGCMPACAQFLTPGARASTFFKSLRSRLLGSHRAGTSTGKTASSKLSASYEQQQQQKRGQFGRGSDQSKQILDYEMSDTQPLKTTARDDDGSEWHHQSNHMSEHRPAQQWV